MNPVHAPVDLIRRQLMRQLMSGSAVSLAGLGGFGPSRSAHALALQTLVFPRDRGTHSDAHIEWWYITGQAKSGQREFGFQVTFFRSRIDATQGMQSKFAAKQLLFAHAAITDVQGNKLWHDQRIARDGFGVAAVSEKDTAIQLRDWSLVTQDGQAGRYTADLPATDFAIKLQFDETQPVLLQGQQGLSRKGPDPRQVSYYYSQPQLATRGTLQIKGQSFEVTGKAWLDHEWSDALLDPSAVGWDWIGMNLDDGSALTAFRLRDKNGDAVWGGGSFRLSGKKEVNAFKQGEVTFKPVRTWKSPLTQTTYPVEWTVRTPAGTYTVKAVIDNQELDSRQSTGSIYWEGLSDLIDSQDQRVGRGYLEMTGYAQALRL